jgi:two-component system, NarL family, nitrate/nitrite response regulator NarL
MELYRATRFLWRIMTPITVCIVSDVRVHCEGLADLLSHWPLIRVLGAHTAADAPSIIRTTNADVALLDMPRPSVVRFLDSLRCNGPSPRFVAIGIRSASEVLTCAAAGIDGFVRTDAPIADTVCMIERVVRGSVGLSTSLALPPAGTVDPGQGEPRTLLTARELQVADLMNLGLANKEIAKSLGVEPCTAKNHVRNILSKLAVHGRGRAVAKLRELIAERFGPAARR